MSPQIGKVLGCFYHRVVRRLIGQMSQLNGDRTWTYPPLGGAMEEAGLHEIETYAVSHQNTVVQYIATRSSMDLFLSAVRHPRARVLERWWEHDSIDLEGIQEAAWVSEAERD